MSGNDSPFGSGNGNQSNQSPDGSQSQWGGTQNGGYGASGAQGGQQYGQSSYGQDPQQGQYGQEGQYGQGSYGQDAQYSQGQYDQSQYGQTAQYGQTPQYGQDAQQGQAAYGQDPQYGQAQFGQQGQFGQDAAYAGQPGQPGQPEKKKSIFTKPWFIITAIGVVVLLLAGILIPVIINMNNVNKGNELAAEFNTALADHEAVWTEDRFNILAGLNVGSNLEANRDFQTQSSGSMSAFEEQCAMVTEAQTALSELQASTVPELELADGADASEDYRAALDASNALEERRAAADQLSVEGQSALDSLAQFCATLPEYNAIDNTRAQNEADLVPTIYTIANGSNLDIGNGLFIPCNQSQGCIDLFNTDTRNHYADVIDAVFTDYYRDTAALASSQCFLSNFQAACDEIATSYNATADAYKAMTDHLRNTQPTVEVGSVLYPELTGLQDAASDAVAAGDAAILQAWQSVDPEADSGRGYQTRSIQNYLNSQQQTLADLVESVR